MHQTDSNCNTQTAKKINTEQIEQIVKAIIAGKYSWACVLILRFSGYNPIDYIPYRTYIRLLKNNCLVESSKSNDIESKRDKLEVFDMKSTLLRL
ncbi:heterocyst formation protein HetP [Nostoc minutum NIES-26]|uniref:Heterocyst formation protein HetP n=1 Tax=Nostoc minutum NIES-26 TaxID=1844469 RepID=A0A367RUJ0_9NOSO|nr:HetP family heterocyst commitment protein [Dendronalium sp. ChiSLP03b]MDZ8206250.1 HetP family heterocyst commitment protein [Dendronalium sp. ChiSLP03b]RCJ40228.1 heterocyst formation protein HetP [Nostoc minutum NIES-26]